MVPAVKSDQVHKPLSPSIALPEFAPENATAKQDEAWKLLLFNQFHDTLVPTNILLPPSLFQTTGPRKL